MRTILNDILICCDLDVPVMTTETAPGMQNDTANFPVTIAAQNSEANKMLSSAELLSASSLPPPPSLSTLLNSDVTISHVVSFNRMFIKLQCQYDTFMELQDEIIDCVDSGNYILSCAVCLLQIYDSSYNSNV